MSEPLKAPFPWFGGKSRVADVAWRAFGNVPNYVEPFYGSGAVLLGRPHAPGVETVNDRDGLIANFWRAIKYAPAEAAHWADWPVNENDLHARHAWLISQMDVLPARLEGDPEWCDPKIAGWWVWGICCWIGSEFCSGKGPWSVQDGKLVHLGAGRGVNRKLVHLGAGRGVNRKLVHLGDAGRGISRNLPSLRGDHGACGTGVTRKNVHLQEWFGALSERLARVRVCCGDWSRVCCPTPTIKQGLTGVFLDPPYSAEAGRDPTIYRTEDLEVARAAAVWAREAGNHPDMRIALCGYEGEHDMPGWTKYVWKAHGGYGAGKGNIGEANVHRERIWFSPHCLPIDEQFDLFGMAAE